MFDMKTKQGQGFDRKYCSCLYVTLFCTGLSAWLFPSIVCCLTAVRDTVRKCCCARKRLSGGEAGCGLKYPEICRLNRSVSRTACSTSPEDI